MADFGWAHLSGAVTGEGPAKSVQYLVTDDGELTGSANFTFNEDLNKLFVTGSVVVSGTLEAHTFDVIHTTRVDLSSSGNTSFGNESGNLHDFTGSVRIKQAGTNDILNLYDNTTEVMTVIDGGNVGIGVSDPDTKLEILGTSDQLKLSYDGSNYSTFAVSSDGDLTVTPSGGDVIITGSTSIDLKSKQIDIGADNGDDTTINLLGTNDMAILYDTSATLLNFDSNTLVIDGANDRVGIGVADPDVPLEISGTSGAQLKLSYGVASANFHVDSSSDLNISASNDVILTSSTAISLQSQNVYIGEFANVADSTVTFLGNTNSMAVSFDQSARKLSFDSTDFVIDGQNARVGIATATPDHTLSVTGTLGVSGLVALSSNLTVQEITASAISASSTLDVVGTANFGPGNDVVIAADGGLTIGHFDANWTNAGRTVADLGIVTTVDINGGSIDGTTIGAASPSTIKATTISGSSTLKMGSHISGSGQLNFPNVSSGSLAGDGSYLGLSTTGNIILTSSIGAISKLNSAVESRLVTIGAVTTELDAESGLTFSSNVLTITGDILPEADNTRDLGSAAKRWANVYTGDLHLRNDRGDWTILEEEDYLCVVNNKTGKRYKMMLQEIEE